MDKETFEGFVSQGERLGYTAEKLQLYVEQCTERYERVLEREAKKIEIGRASCRERVSRVV